MNTQLTPAVILKAVARELEAQNLHDFPVYTVWNAFAPLMRLSVHAVAVQRYADAVAPGWRQRVQIT